MTPHFICFFLPIYNFTIVGNTSITCISEMRLKVYYRKMIITEKTSK